MKAELNKWKDIHKNVYKYVYMHAWIGKFNPTK